LKMELLVPMVLNFRALELKQVTVEMEVS
jgi:hypothetical protein